MLRYNADETPDSNFDGDGIVTTPGSLSGGAGAWRVAIQPDKKLVVAGVHADLGNVLSSLVLRYDDAGTLDSSFDGDGMAEIPGIERFIGVALQSGGKIVLLAKNPNERVRLNPDGSLDGTFGDGGHATVGPARWIDRFAVQADGKIVVAAALTNGSGDDVGVRRLYRSSTAASTVASTSGAPMRQAISASDWRAAREYQRCAMFGLLAAASARSRVSAACRRSCASKILRRPYSRIGLRQSIPTADAGDCPVAGRRRRLRAHICRATPALRESRGLSSSLPSSSAGGRSCSR